VCRVYIPLFYTMDPEVGLSSPAHPPLVGLSSDSGKFDLVIGGGAVLSVGASTFADGRRKLPTVAINTTTPSGVKASEAGSKILNNTRVP
jgi:hypothetical protein